MKYKLAVFDLDGTILDTLEDLADSVNYALTERGLPVRTIDEVRQFVGNGIRKLIERAVPSGTSDGVTDAVFEAFSEYYKVHCKDKTKPYDGIIKVLSSLRQKGIFTAVVSNKADFAVQILCEDFFTGMFDFTVGEKMGIRKKPYPDSLIAVVDEIGVSLGETVYIGDSDVDLETAGNAGVDVIMVSWGFRDEEFLRRCGAEFVIHKPEEILEYI